MGFHGSYLPGCINEIVIEINLLKCVDKAQRGVPLT